MTAAACIPYGRTWPGSDAWADRDGRIYYGAGPYQHRLLHRLRRRLRRLVTA